jgi:hypothetical protein
MKLLFDPGTFGGFPAGIPNHLGAGRVIGAVAQAAGEQPGGWLAGQAEVVKGRESRLPSAILTAVYVPPSDLVVEAPGKVLISEWVPLHSWRQIAMYWLNLNSLKRELKQGHLTQAHAFQYALAGTVLTSLAGAAKADPWWEALLTAAIAGLGTAYCYEANGGAAGSDFVARYVSLGWVVALRVALGYTPAAVIVGVLAAPAFADARLLISAVGLGFVVLFYWRLGIHFADVCRRPAAVIAA